MDMSRGSLPAAATIGRSDDVAGILNKMLEAILLDISSIDESTIHPANGLLIQELQSHSDCSHLVHHTIDPYSLMVDCWAAKLEKDAKLIQGGKYVFLLNNTFDVLQMVRRSGACFASDELASRLTSMIQGYKECYLEECWAPLNRLNLEEFAAEFPVTCNRQMTWKVTAELRYQLRQEILDFIVPPYEVSLSSKGRRISRLTVRNKKQRRYTCEELEQKIRGLFEG